MMWPTTPQLLQKLRQRYATEAFAFLSNVPSSTGGGAARYADAVCMSLWPSRGLFLDGFELKVSRSDWLAEYRNPAKAEEIARYCDHWWMVTAHDSLIQDHELPDTWGWLSCDETGKLRIKKKAPLTPSEPIDAKFLAALLRASTAKSVPKDQVDPMISDAVERGRQSAKHKIEYAEEKWKGLFDRVQKFEKLSGVRIDGWDNIEPIGRAVYDILNGRVDSVERDLQSLKYSAERIVKIINESLEAYESREI